MTFIEALYKINSKAKLDLDSLGKYMSEYASKYELTTSARQSAFLANFAHETDSLNSLIEYASGEAYEGRTDLGNNQPGDGKKFKGRGGLMITGRGNYKTVSQEIFGDDRLLNTPELLQESKYAVISSFIFWDKRNLNSLADSGDFEGIVKKINGGLNGWADRLSYFDKIKIFLKNNPIKSYSFGIVILIIALTVLSVLYIKNNEGQ